MELGFERTACLINNTAMQQENARQAREIETLKDTIRSTEIANRAVEQMQRFALTNYKPTAFGNGATTSA